MSPVKVIVQPVGAGARRISLRCRCARVGRMATPEEATPDVLADLLARHARLAPLCRHPRPGTLA